MILKIVRFHCYLWRKQWKQPFWMLFAIVLNIFWELMVFAIVLMICWRNACDLIPNSFRELFSSKMKGTAVRGGLVAVSLRIFPVKKKKKKKSENTLVNMSTSFISCTLPCSPVHSRLLQSISRLLSQRVPPPNSNIYIHIGPPEVIGVWWVFFVVFVFL